VTHRPSSGEPEAPLDRHALCRAPTRRRSVTAPDSDGTVQHVRAHAVAGVVESAPGPVLLISATVTTILRALTR